MILWVDAEVYDFAGRGGAGGEGIELFEHFGLFLVGTGGV
jgi:hypothetical protein